MFCQYVFGQNASYSTSSSESDYRDRSYSSSVRTNSAGLTPRDRAYDQVTVPRRTVVPYAHLREADVFIERRIYREIPFDEKMNLRFLYPERTFAEILLEDPNIQAYSVDDDKFTKPVDPSVVRAFGTSVDTVLVVDPISGEETYETIVNEFDFTKVRKLRIKEDWIFDKQRSTFFVRIIGITPIYSQYDQNGNFIAELPMFWFYYPDVRNLLVNEMAFNPGNDAAILSWDDIFEMRLFSSYIIKEPNVYDRRIKDYAIGIDALLEEERIEKELFEKEHDLWSI